MQAYNEQYKTKTSRTGIFVNYFFRGFATGLMLVLLLSGLTTYADYKNASAQSALYPLKRLRESVAITLLDEDKEPAYYAKLAERRWGELNNLNTKETGSKMATELQHDLRLSLQKTALALKEPEEANEIQATLEASDLGLDQIEAKDTGAKETILGSAAPTAVTLGVENEEEVQPEEENISEPKIIRPETPNANDSDSVVVDKKTTGSRGGGGMIDVLFKEKQMKAVPAICTALSGIIQSSADSLNFLEDDLQLIERMREACVGRE